MLRPEGYYVGTNHVRAVLSVGRTAVFTWRHAMPSAARSDAIHPEETFLTRHLVSIAG
jgi:hypothetical protein